VLLAGYSFDHGREILEPLHTAMRDRNVAVDMYLHVERAPRNEADLDRYAEKEMVSFLARNWPFGPPHPVLHYDPRTLQPRSIESLHAKCIVVDERLALIGSAMTALGFATGLRPSSLRPLRRHGPTPDILWEKGVLLVRQSHTRHQEVMKTTKTKRYQRLTLPPDLMEILRWHVAELAEGPMQESDLLFPSELGGYRSPSCLDKPFKEVSRLVGLGKKLTPRGMRRTFQDLARAAEVKDVVTRAVSGHVTEAMQRHYGTVAPDEMRQELAKVVMLAGFREAMEANWSSGAKSGAKAHETEEAGSVGRANRPVSADLADN
jgi:integrase